MAKFGTYFRDADTGLDYADQRYYSPGWGRFLTPDPSVESMSTMNPSSFNRYAYTYGDPVNLGDPSGLNPEVAGDGIPLVSWLTFGLFGSGLPANYFDVLIWKTSPEKKVNEWDVRIAAAFADAARQQETDNPFKHYPHHLQVIEDCYTFYVGSKSRLRTYEIRDETDHIIAGSVWVQEYNYVVSGQQMSSIGSHWTSARFTDNLARGNNGDITMYQQFTVQIWGLNSTPGAIPIMVRELDGRDYGTLGIKLENDVVWINGNDGRRSDGSLNTCR
jgi:RHS repeat-associated protein